VAENPYRLS